MTTIHLRPPAALTAATTLAAALSTLLLLPLATSHAAASFALSDGVGDVTSGTYNQGSSFTLAVTFTSTTTSTGYSLWIDTATATAPNLSIGSFTLTSASFPDRISGNGSQPFDTNNSGRPGFLSNLSDLGAVVSNTNMPVAAGSYQVENITFLLGSNIPAGTYTLQTTPAASGGRASGGSDAAFNFFNAPSAVYTFTVVPEPSTWAMALGGLGVLGLVQQRRRRTA